ncbi:HAMP domain-containing sensor histidine kinase [Calothrix sp. UHCC 0171]|uniref:sensor histidine kinase n=1 Tax=Calothrix sp. UHCC 0171 TaxID=3110245 RepID=UPI002B1EB40B|nr:HAMP domain-containing sensor histidine kinase [Calothrix sp. UHCC 0171]MEA5570478.1 HAMP domain-containing sensor histidine kinase [Calothrix sp. UHCC 0171]
MSMSASSEFVALAREQMALLAQGLGASLSVLYLTQELVQSPTKEAKLVPVVVYPENSVLGQMHSIDWVTMETGYPDWLEENSEENKNPLSFPRSQRLLTGGENYLEASREFVDSNTSFSAGLPNQEIPDLQNELLLNGVREAFPRENRVVLPLIHEDMMMGVLVTTRNHRNWNDRELSEIKRVVQTITLACILDRKQVWLRQQLHSSQILQEKQQDLLDNLLHQFRNPLTALRTFGKLLMKRLQPGDRNRDAAESIVRESDRLQELLQKFEEVIDLTDRDLAGLLPVNNQIQNQLVVDISQQKQPKPALLLPGSNETVSECNIADILKPLLDSASAIAQERNLELVTEIPANLPKIKANTKALREVFNNIIDNALKYTPAQGAILVQAGQEKNREQNQKQLRMQGISISDTGCGIPQQDLEHIGERHYRGVQAQTEIPGTGLGLAIAKQLIEEMQGEIQVFSPALNSIIKNPATPGTTFIIWLPICD